MPLNLYALWPFTAFLLGLRMGLQQLGTPRPKDRLWWIWLGLAAALLHEFEESGFDLFGRRYAFQPFICRHMGYRGAEVAICPLQLRTAVLLSWSLNIIPASLAIYVGGSVRPISGAVAMVTFLLDAFLHLIGAVVLGSYNPGLVTALLLIVPLVYQYLQAAATTYWLRWPHLCFLVFLAAAQHATTWLTLFQAPPAHPHQWSYVDGVVVLLGCLPLICLVFPQVPNVKHAHLT